MKKSTNPTTTTKPTNPAKSTAKPAKTNPTTSAPITTKTWQDLEKTLKFHARALDIPAGAASDFIARTLKDAKSSLASKKIITKKDLTTAVTKSLKKYHKDLAYVYENYDKII